MAVELQLQCHRGAAIGGHLQALAQLRIEVFRAYPYLYDGDTEYEATYLASYTRSDASLAVLALAEGRVVGASTGLPLADEEPAFWQPFLQRGIAIDSVFYCGESVLLADYRGRGLGHRFFDLREAHARRLRRFAWTAFAAVERAADDPRRPPDYRELAGFWQARGYQRQPGMSMQLSWKELGQVAASEHALTFWLRPLEPDQ